MSRAPDKPFNVKLPEDSTEYGALQRLIIDVPAPATTLLLGHRWTEDPPFAYEGVNVCTAENFFVDITKRTLFQGHQAVVFQTDETWTQYSTGKTYVYAKADHDLTSGATVLIASVPPGSETVGADMKERHGEEVPAAKSYIPVRDKLLGDEHAAGVDKASAPAGELNSAKADAGWPYAGDDEAQKAVDELKAAATTLKGDGASRTVGVGVVSKQPIALLTSTRLIAYAGTGVSFVAGNSDAPSDFTAFATKGAALRAAGRAEVVGTTSASLHGAVADVAATGDAALCSRGANAVVVGKEVHLGAIAAAGELGSFEGVDTGTQKDTDNVVIESKKLTSVKSNDKIEAEATNAIKFTVGQFKLEFTTSSIKLGFGSTPSTIEIKNSSIELKVAASSVKIEAAGITLKSGGGEVKVGPAGVTVNGMPIQLG